MKRRSLPFLVAMTVAVSALALASLTRSAIAQPATAMPQPAASPSPAQTPKLEPCAVWVAEIWPVDPIDETASTFAIRLDSLNDDDSIATGTIALNAGIDRYEIPFGKATVSGVPHKGTWTPVLVRFPRSVHIDRAYVSSLEGRPRRCVPLSALPAWHFRPSTSSGHERVTRQTRETQPLPAPEPVKESPAPCAGPDREATTKLAVAPAPDDVVPRNARDPFPSLSTFSTSTATIAVVFTDDAQLVGLKVYQSSGSRNHDREAMEAARISSYLPMIRDCRSFGGLYVFRATYERSGP
jgi:hypothetical protein